MIGPYGVAQSMPVAQQRVADVYGKQGGSPPAGNPGCWDWSAYCGQGEFAEDYTLVFDFFLTNTTPIVPGATRDALATVTPEGRFVCVSRVASSTPLAASFATTEMDIGSQRLLESDFVDGPNRYGTIQRPANLFIPRLIGAQGSVKITLRNDDAVNITAFQIAYVGFKVLDMEKLNASIRRCI